jgi:molecular chaperone GrpE
MSKGKENRSRRIPVRVVGEEDEISTEPMATETVIEEAPELESPVEAVAEASSEHEPPVEAATDAVPPAEPATGDELDANETPSVSDLLRELEAQDQAEAEALAKSRSVSEFVQPPLSRGERAAAALAHQALTELGGLRAENAQLRNRAGNLENDKTEVLDRLIRLQADFDNLRKRTERERTDIHSRLVLDVAKKLLPVIDNLNRAVNAEDSVQASESEEFRHFWNGVKLINKQLTEVLENLGIEAIPAIGEPFDPNFHEAVATEQSDQIEPDLITEELARGYRMGNKLLRPSMVKVSTR